MNEKEKFDKAVGRAILEVGDFQKGDRNNFVFTLAAKCKAYQIDKSFTLGEIINRFRDRDFTETEIRNAVNSAYKYHGKVQKAKSTSSNNLQTNIDTRPLNESELAYWQKYKILPKILEIYGVLAVNSYQVGSHIENTEMDNPIFCYQAEGSYKIYRPCAREGQNKFIWIGNRPKDWYFGLEYCKGSERVYLTGGEKDVLTLICQGVEAFPLNSETASMPQDLADKLKMQYNEVIVLYDNDKTGQDNSKKICNQHDFTRGILPDGVKDVSDLIKSGRSFNEVTLQAPSEDDFFICKSVNECLEESKRTPPQPQLCGPFITKGELTIIFSDPSAGKSVLAVQIGEGSCKGLQIMGLKNEAGPMNVIYFDFELSAKQFEKRNSGEDGSLHKFPANFYRAEINGLAEVEDEKLEEVIFNKIEKLTNKLKADLIIIDNISWLHSEADKAKFAVPLMRKLKGLVKKQGLTVVVINHTVKREESRAITANDMAGSKQLRALSDMIFTIGRSSQSKNIRYLKMLKDNRTTGEIYGPDNILVCELVKTDYLHFEYLTEGREVDYLPKIENREHNPKDEQKTAAKILKASGHSNIEISALLKVTEGTIRNWLK